MKPSILVMGICGSGKSTIGQQLSERMGIPFLEADEFHSSANIQKMKDGHPLNDDDRQPWLESLAKEIKKHEETGSVLACSALKEKYRKTLESLIDKPILVIHLEGSYELIKNRMESRSNHFMPSDLIKSQLRDLEKPKIALTYNIEKDPEVIVEQILKELENDMKAEIGIIGLGVMGKSLARNFSSRDIKTVVYNAPLPGEENVTTNFVNQFPENNFLSANTLLELTQQLNSPRVILLMVKSGDPVDELIGKLTPLLDKDDIIIDAGNSFFKDSIRRYQECKENDIHFVGMGVSGGEEGALKGPSIMPAGSEFSKKKILPMLHKVAAIADGKPCVNWIGEDGSGHFVKMVHNGIEYADMQILSEAYSIAKNILDLDNNTIADVFSEWKKRIHNSYLLDITIDILRFKENGKPLLEEILDVAGHKGTGLWTVKEALDLGVAIPTISAAMNERIISGNKNLREQLADFFPNKKNKTEEKSQDLKLLLEDGILFARLIALAEGFYFIKKACEKFDWKIDSAVVAQLWRGGCIIRSDMLLELVEAFESNPDAEHLFEIPEFQSLITEKYISAKALLEIIISEDISTPSLLAAISYYKTLHTKYLPINLIQAQRDFFGAHTYRKLEDRNSKFHTNWKK